MDFVSWSTKKSWLQCIPRFMVLCDQNTWPQNDDVVWRLKVNFRLVKDHSPPRHDNINQIRLGCLENYMTWSLVAMISKAFCSSCGTWSRNQIRKGRTLSHAALALKMSNNLTHGWLAKKLMGCIWMIKDINWSVESDIWNLGWWFYVKKKYRFFWSWLDRMATIIYPSKVPVACMLMLLVEGPKHPLKGVVKSRL